VPRFIETIPKRGYRLVASVQRPASDEIEEPRPADDPHQPLAVIVNDRAVIKERPVHEAVERFLIFGEREIPLIGDSVTFGRSSDVEIQILAPEISRRHARIDLELRRTVIRDLGSKNGTQVNELTISGPRDLETGDVLAFGTISMTFCHVTTDETLTQADI
jgi:hypothetical protein